MPTIRVTTALAAGGTNPNMLAGSQFEFLRAPARVQIYAIQDSTGAAGVGEIEVFFGQEIELPQARPNLAALGPVIPNDLVVDDFGAPQDRLVVRAIETGGALGATLTVLVKIDPIPMG
jgi:hypothetical protein